MKKNIEKQRAKLQKMQKTAGVKPEVYERYMRMYGQQMSKMEKAGAQLTKAAAKSPVGKIMLRGVLCFVGEIIPILIGIIPFWTISVVMMLREK
jgi:hypothetical protein